MSSLPGLEKAIRRHVAGKVGARCSSCMAPGVASATRRALAAAVRTPQKYAGMTVGVLHVWCGAAKAGIGRGAYIKHLVNHTEGLWTRFTGG